LGKIIITVVNIFEVECASKLNCVVTRFSCFLLW